MTQDKTDVRDSLPTLKGRVSLSPSPMKIKCENMAKCINCNHSTNINKKFGIVHSRALWADEPNGGWWFCAVKVRGKTTYQWDTETCKCNKPELNSLPILKDGVSLGAN